MGMEESEMDREIFPHAANITIASGWSVEFKMSALSVSRPCAVAIACVPCDAGPSPPPTPMASPDSCYSPLPSLTHSSPSSSASSIHSVPERPNEHLAVLLPRHLWKVNRLTPLSRTRPHSSASAGRLRGIQMRQLLLPSRVHFACPETC